MIPIISGMAQPHILIHLVTHAPKPGDDPNPDVVAAAI